MLAHYLTALICFFTVCETPAPDLTPAEVVVVDVCEQIPGRACAYIPLLSVSTNPSRHAAQLDQESNFNPMAQSPYAYGIAQFTPATGKWMAGGMCKHLGAWQKYDPDWGIQCSIVYMDFLEANVPTTGGYCDTRRNAERGYNGGLGWLNKEASHTHDYSTEGLSNVCRRTGRAEWACKENTDYPRRISTRQINFIPLGGTLC